MTYYCRKSGDFDIFQKIVQYSADYLSLHIYKTEIFQKKLTFLEKNFDL